MFAASKVTTHVRMLCFGINTDPYSFCHSFIALSMMIHCSKSAQKSAIQIRHGRGLGSYVCIFGYFQLC